jgi:hypothetical protein
MKFWLIPVNLLSMLDQIPEFFPDFSKSLTFLHFRQNLRQFPKKFDEFCQCLSIFFHFCPKFLNFPPIFRNPWLFLQFRQNSHQFPIKFDEFLQILTKFLPFSTKLSTSYLNFNFYNNFPPFSSKLTKVVEFSYCIASRVFNLQRTTFELAPARPVRGRRAERSLWGLGQRI